MPQMNPPSVSPRLCHRTSGASFAPGVAEARGTRAPGRFLAATSSGLIPRHRYQAARKWIHGHQGEDGQSAPPGLWCRKRGPPLNQGGGWRKKPSRRTVSPPRCPHFLPHHPFPPVYVPPPVSMGTGGSRHGTLSTMRRRGDYRQGAAAADDPGVRGLYHGKGREGPKGTPPPPAAAKCLTP